MFDILTLLPWKATDRAVTHASALGLFRRVSTGSSSNGFFVFHSDSDTMRYVSGGVLNNPVTRASQSRDGGRIPRAGWLKQVWDSAVRGHGSEDHKHRANCI